MFDFLKKLLKNNNEWEKVKHPPRWINMNRLESMVKSPNGTYVKYLYGKHYVYKYEGYMKPDGYGHYGLDPLICSHLYRKKR